MMHLIDLCVKGDERGSLISLEANKSIIPFEIKRVYYIFNTQTEVVRGLHAHKKLHQLLICVSGSCKIILDNGLKKEAVELNSPIKGLLIKPITWRKIYDFSSDCVLMVLADNYYDESDYIRDYQEFLKLCK